MTDEVKSNMTTQKTTKKFSHFSSATELNAARASADADFAQMSAAARGLKRPMATHEPTPKADVPAEWVENVLNDSDQTSPNIAAQLCESMADAADAAAREADREAQEDFEAAQLPQKKVVDYTVASVFLEEKAPLARGKLESIRETAKMQAQSVVSHLKERVFNG
eukprot:9494780-Pyramimonas_sp.AAC.1